MRSGAVLLLAFAGTACGGPRPLVWHDEAGYRWAELHVPRRGKVGFTRLDPERTGVAFTNNVTEEQLLENEHLLNGSGVAVGDVDRDGWVDIYFARLDGPNVLYRNLGGWKFEDVTDRSGVALPEQYSSGATFADVDGDRDLDLLVTSVGGPTSLFLNDGAGVFANVTPRAGLDSGFYGTTMALADTDGDGDLDLYVTHNKVRTVRDMYPPDEIEFDRVVRQTNGTFTVVPEFREHFGVAKHGNVLMRFELAEPDRFYLNDGTGRFEDVSIASEWFTLPDGRPLTEEPRYWGLTARFQDFDGDGDPDLYVCNDFESPDLVWINDGTGRFRMIDPVALRTTSNADMAIDFSDIDRDGDVDMLTLDMLDRNSGKQKTQSPAGVLDVSELGDIDIQQQLPRNVLLLNRGDGTFAEAALMAGVEASGWSWSGLFLDVDLDGYEDALISTGHAFDFLDSDTKEMIRTMPADRDWRRTRLLHPELPLPNVVFRNRGDLTFEEVGREWGFAPEPDISHGTALGDLDRDGDLDVVANRLYWPANLFRNETNLPRVAVRLTGLAPNTQGVGAKIYVLGGPVPVQSKEVTAGGLYASSSEPTYSFAAGEAETVTIAVNWRSGSWSVIENALPNRIYEISEGGAGAPGAVPAHVATAVVHDSPSPLFTDVSAELGHVHAETAYNDFGRQLLLPNKLSQLGPGVSWYDVDSDGYEDLIVPSGAGGRLALFKNEGGRLRVVSLGVATTGSDQSAVLAVPRDGGGSVLLVGQSNYEAESPAAALEIPSVVALEFAPRPIGHSARPRARALVPGAMSTTGPLALADYDQDGDLDLFVGGRVLPARYPSPASSRLFSNDGGHFELDTLNSRPLSGVGLVSAAMFADVDGDGDADLVLALEWGPIRLYVNDGGRFSDATEAWGLAVVTSRWNGVTAGDLDGDGRLDLVATSWGRNTRFRTDPERTYRVYYGDFDRNGTTDVVEARFDPRLGDLVPLRGRIELTRGMPFVGRLIASFDEYADATLADILGPRLADADVLEVTTLDHTLFLNRGGRFEPRSLPIEAQIAPAFYAGVADMDGDGNEDVFLSQNFFPGATRTQRYMSGRGLWLQGDGNGRLVPREGTVTGVRVYGDQRGAGLADYDGDGRVDLAVSQNANATKLFKNVGARSGLRVRLVGPPGNPRAYGAAMRLVYPDGRGPLREVRGGSGYWSLDGAVQVLGLRAEPDSLWVRWPDGTETTVPVAERTRQIVIRWERGT
ncbi:MAG: CRTAC1 family protein [Gemmatimonadales bacterium]